MTLSSNKHQVTPENRTRVWNATDETVSPIKDTTKLLISSPQRQALNLLIKYNLIEADTIETLKGSVRIKWVWNLRVNLWTEGIDDLEWKEVEENIKTPDLDNKGLANKQQMQNLLDFVNNIRDKLLISSDKWPIESEKAICPKKIFLEDIMGMRDGTYRIKNSNPHSVYKDVLMKKWWKLSLSYADKEKAAGYILQV